MTIHYFVRIALFTVTQALLSTAVAAAVGLGAAFFIARRRFFARRFFLSLSVIPLCLPALIMALGYVTLFGLSGGVNTLLKALFGKDAVQLMFLYSVAGIVVAQGFFNAPLVMATVAESWSRLPAAEADSARLLGASERRVFCTVTVYQLASAIVSACIPVFLFCFFSFLIVLLFGGVGCATLEVEIFRNVRSDAARAFLLSGIETAVAVAVVSLYCRAEQKTLTGAGKGLEAAQQLRKPIRHFGERAVFCAVFLLVALFFLCPLAGIVWNAITAQTGGITLRNFLRVFSMQTFSLALKGTLITACATGTGCTVLAFGYAVFLHLHGSFSRHLAARLIPMLPMAISSMTTGALLIRLFPRSSVITLVCAQTALYWPFAFRLVYAELSKIPRETVEAASLLSRHRLQTITRIYLPCSIRSCISAAGCSFALSAGDTTLPLVLGIPGFHSLALFTYRLSSRYRFHEACASGVLLAVLCMVVYSSARALKKD